MYSRMIAHSGISSSEKPSDFFNSSIETPLVLGASSVSLFEKAVSVYVGRCIYDEECGFDKEQVEILKNKYGFIVSSDIIDS